MRLSEYKDFSLTNEDIDKIVYSNINDSGEYGTIMASMAVKKL